MSKWTNVRKFDFGKGEYTNSYYKLSDFDYFVDSEFGSDTNDGLTPQTAFKTLSKITTLGSSFYKNGIKVACCGIFDSYNDSSSVKMAEYVGCGGINGRARIYGGNHWGIFHNIIFEGIGNLGWGQNASYDDNASTTKLVNCIIKDRTMPLDVNNWRGLYIRSYFSIFINSTFYYTSYPNAGIYGNNNSFLGLSASSITKLVLYGIDNHTTFDATTKQNPNVINTDSRYFTDNTETTPADLYIDSVNGNYGIVPTFSTPIWDKQTQQYITANPLYNEGNIIGAGFETLALTALDDSLKSTDNGGDATYSNMDNPTSTTICRIDDSTDGTLTSGVQDLERVMNGVKIDAIATYDTNGGLITKRLQQSTPSIEQTTDFGIQFGETEQECRDMTPILCEYGKVITYSKSGNILYGNSDLNFQPDKKKVAKFRYFIISIRAKTIS